MAPRAVSSAPSVSRLVPAVGIANAADATLVQMFAVAVCIRNESMAKLAKA